MPCSSVPVAGFSAQAHGGAQHGAAAPVHAVRQGLQVPLQADGAHDDAHEGEPPSLRRLPQVLHGVLDAAASPVSLRRRRGGVGESAGGGDVGRPGRLHVRRVQRAVLRPGRGERARHAARRRLVASGDGGRRPEARPRVTKEGLM